MDYIIYLTRAIYRKLFWIILFTAIVTIFIFWKTSKMHGDYSVETTLYTGVISGYGIEDNNISINYAMAQNAIDNLVNIIQSESTLKRVSINLFARVLVEGDPNKDQNGITSTSYNYTFNHLKNSPQGNELIGLIDRNSQEKTVHNFLNFEKADRNNYIYGLFYFQHPYYSYSALKRIIVARLGNSDLLRIKYSSGDPGIAYNTIEILMTEFVNEYRALRYGETDNVIAYFKSELEKISQQLTQDEDDLTNYNVENKIINYYDETKEIAAINKEYELREQTILFEYNSSKAMLNELEQQMVLNEKQAISSIKMLDKLKKASNLTNKISEMETVVISDSITNDLLKTYKYELDVIRQELSLISQQYVGEKYSKTGLMRNNIVEQWLDQTLVYEKAKAELSIIQNSRNNLDQKYEFFAPIGTTIKRKERTINFSEQSYLANLSSYNEALMRKKNLEMTSASLKVLNPPAYPINSESTSRKKIVIIACLGTFFFLIIFFLIVELIDRTLKDSTRTKKLTQCPILSSFPPIDSYNIYNKSYENIAIRNLSNAILGSLMPRTNNAPYIINILGLEHYSNKEYISNLLCSYWHSIGLKVSLLACNKDFYPESANYLLAQNISDLANISNFDVVIVEHPDMCQCNIPTSLLLEGNINILILSAKYGWKAQDSILLSKLEEQLDDKPYICLSDAPKYDIENFTGMLPPYTPLRNIMYGISQLSITEFFKQRRNCFSINNKQTKKKQTATLDDDD